MHAGYTIKPSAIAEDISKTLEAVRGYRLVNELLQNADDSGASNFALGWAPTGITGANHPLLQIPAVYCANDGVFTIRDAEAIHEMRASGKADRAGSIGKFGLGLKAVHELCEAFFYVGMIEDPSGVSRERRLRAGVLSPWVKSAAGEGASIEPSLMMEWAEFGHASGADLPTVADERLLLRYVTDELQWDRVTFALWIPLRRRDHTARSNGKSVFIRNVYFDGPDRPYPTELFSRDAQDTIARALPLLKNIQRACLIGPTQPREFIATLLPGSRRRSYPRELRSDDDWSARSGALVPSEVVGLQGQVAIEGAEPWRYVGAEWSVRDMVDWSSRRGWPQAANAAAADGEIQVRDKTSPHVAAVLAWSPKKQGEGRLVVLWSTFLPLGEPPMEVELDAKLDVVLNLHGYFFLRADRTSASQPDLDRRLGEAASLETEWNERLKRNGTLRLVLSTLEAFETQVTDHPRGADYVRALTKGIESSRLFRDFRNDICKVTGWAWALRDGEGPRWSLMPSSVELLVCPNVEELERLVPSLARVLGQSRAITSADAPSLTLKPRLNRWPAELIRAVLEHVDVTVASTPAGVRILRSFLDSAAGGPTAHESFTDVLIRITRQMLRSLESDSLSSVNQEVAALLRFVPEDRRLQLPTGTPDQVASRVLAADLPLVAYPQEMDISATTRMSVEVARKILKLTEGYRATELVLAVLKAMQHPIQVLKSPELVDAELIDVSVAGVGKRISYRQVEKTISEKRLFSATLVAGVDVTSLLEACLPRCELLRLDQRWTRVVLPGSRNAPETALQLLATLPELTDDFAARRQLVETLARHAWDTPDWSGVARYLIIGQRQAFMKRNELLYYSVQEYPKAAAIVHELLKARGESWRVLSDPEGSLRTIGLNLENLGILKITDSILEQMIYEQWVGRSLPGTLLADDFDYILNTLKPVEPARRLSIHETRAGTRVAASEAIGLDTSLALALQDETTLLDPGRIVVPYPDGTELRSKQETLGLRPISSEVLYSMVLRDSSPSSHWRTVLALLDREPPGENEMARLRGTRWLPTSGGPVAPDRVLHLPEVQQFVDIALEGGGNGYASSSALLDELQQPENLAKLLKKRILDQRGMVRTLAKLLADNPVFKIGLASLGQHSGKAARLSEDWVGSFKGDTTRFPAADLLARLSKQDRIDAWEGLLAPVPVERVFEHLDYLSNRFIKPNGDVRDLYVLYLEEARRQSAEWLRHPGLRLLDRNGDWKKPESLTHDIQGAAPSHLVDSGQGNLLSSAATSRAVGSPTRTRGNTTTLVEYDESNTFATLLESFRGWPTRLEKHIGALVSLLGGEAVVKGYAQRMLGGQAGIPRGLVLSNLGSTRPQANKRELRAEVDDRRFAVKLQETGAFEATNLYGARITVPIDADYDKLIVGAVEAIRGTSPRHLGVQIRQVAEKNPTRLEELLRNTVKHLLEVVYRWPTDAVDSTFAWLDERDQFPLEVAQENFLETAFTYVKNQLGAKSEALSKVFREWEQARSVAAAARLAGSLAIPKAPGKLDELRRRLRTLVETDEDTQRTILEAVRRKLAESQYQVSSIPFEILQNADDAVLELEELQGPGPSAHRRFAVVAGARRLDLMHWGRRINYGHGGTNHAFHLDLERMLTLGASDKDHSDRKRDLLSPTGKFGLGFKSTLLYSERPKVLSGELAFEVVGGAYPRAVPRSSPDFEKMSTALGKYGDVGQGTLIRLDGDDGKTSEVIGRFKDLGGYLLLFTRAIDRLEIEVDGKTTLDARRVRKEIWVPNAELVEISEQSPLFRVVMLGGPTQLRLALGLSSAGFVGLPDGVPDVWVTMPTQDKGKRKIAINGDFALDIGRAQLARASEGNRRLAAEFASVLSGTLVSMYEGWKNDSTAFRTALGFAHGLGHKVWDSLFDTLSHEIRHPTDGDAADELFWEALWSTEGGARVFIETCEAMPTRLPPPYDGPTRLGAVKFIVSGPWVRPDVFAALGQSSGFRGAFPVGSLISRKVYETLLRLRVAPEVEEVRLMAVLDAAIGRDPVATPDTLALLGLLRDSAILKPGRLPDDERGAIQELLKRVQFRNQESPPKWVQVRRLMAQSHDLDPAGIAGFAPREWLASVDYGEQGIELLRWCRGPLDVPPEVRSGWIKAAQTPSAQRSAAKFLTSSDEGIGLLVRLSDEVQGTWLESAPGRSDLDPITSRRLTKILGSPRGEGREPIVEVPPPVLPHLVAENPRDLFQKVAALWASESSSLIAKYEGQTFPWPLQLRSEFDPADRIQRRDWLTLLLLGGLRNLGRTRPEQDRDFLRLCEDSGWMATFVESGRGDDSGRSRGSAWVRVIDEFLEKDDTGQYRHWFAEFITIYQASTWLDDYVELLLGLDRATEDTEIRGVWQPKSSSAFSGSGIDVPSLQKALRIGRPFVIRELLRRGVLKNERLKPFAFYMSGPTRESLARVVGQMPDEPMKASESLWRALKGTLNEEASFGGSYDLPFTLGLHEVK